MMGRLFLLIAIVLLGAWLLRWFKRTPVELVRRQIRNTLIFLALIALVLLASTGRLHWLFALIGGLLALVMRLLPLLRYLPIVDRFLKSQRAHGGQSSSRTRDSMSREEALAVLGLSDHPSREEIITAHRHLIQKIHPDRGGSDHLAAQINYAKDILLGE